MTIGRTRRRAQIERVASHPWTTEVGPLSARWLRAFIPVCNRKGYRRHRHKRGDDRGELCLHTGNISSRGHVESGDNVMMADSLRERERPAPGAARAAPSLPRRCGARPRSVPREAQCQRTSGRKRQLEGFSEPREIEAKVIPPSPTWIRRLSVLPPDNYTALLRGTPAPASPRRDLQY